MSKLKLTNVVIGSSLLLAMALPVFAQTYGTTGSTGTTVNPPAPVTTTAVPVPPKKKMLDAVCMQNAVGKRDDAIMAAVDVYHDAVKAALTTRKAALIAAWGQTTSKDRRAALKAAWIAYASAIKQAVKDMRAAKQSAWNQFYSDRKLCGPGAAVEDSTTHGADSQL